LISAASAARPARRLMASVWRPQSPNVRSCRIAFYSHIKPAIASVSPSRERYAIAAGA
jgi:hypothetical protein